MLFFVYDVESDGLYGEGFAFGAVVVDHQGMLIDACSAGALDGVCDAWTRENVLPMLTKVPQKANRRAVRDDFWAFYEKWKDKCYFLVDVGYPVDMGFMAACVRDDEEKRRFMAPYPLLDVSSLMFAAGLDPLTDGAQFTGIAADTHDPISDARISAAKVIRLLKEKKIVLPD